MEDRLLETIIKAAYDAGYKDGYTKVSKNTKYDKDEPAQEQRFIQVKWINPKVFAEEFGMAITTQAKLRMQRKIPYTKIGGFIYYNRNDIDQWLELHKLG
jgi:hypothetical protein